MNTQRTVTDTRLDSLERSSNRWRIAAITILAGGVGLLVGGLTERSLPVYDYAASNTTLYRFGPDGSIEYMKVEEGVHTSEGYLYWGEMRVNDDRRYPPKP